MRHIPDVIIYLTGLITTIFLAFCSIYFASNKTLGIWLLFGCIVFGLLTGFLYWQNDIWKIQAKLGNEKEPIIYLNSATIKPLLINGKTDNNNFKISFEIKNIGDKEIDIIKNKIYIVDLNNKKYEKVEEEINPQTLYPNGPPISSFLVGYSKEMFKTHRHFILIIEYIDKRNNKGVKYFFNKLQELKIMPSTYDMDLIVVNKDEEKEIIDMLRYLIEQGIEKSELLRKELEHLYPEYNTEAEAILKATYVCRNKNYEQSLNILKLLDEKTISSENKQVYFNLIGFCYAKLSDYENAKKYLKLAVEINTNEKITNEAVNNLKKIQNIKTGINIEKKEIIFLGKRNNVFVYKVSFQARFVNGNKDKELNLTQVDIILKNMKNNTKDVKTVNQEYTIQKDGYYLTDYVSYEVDFLEKVDGFNLIIKGYFDNCDTMETNVIEKVIY